MTQSIKDVRETGRKHHIIETQKAMKPKSDRGAVLGAGGSWGPFGGMSSGAGDLLSS
jgi:hypothetical protein